MEINFTNAGIFLVFFTIAFILMDEHIAKPWRRSRLERLANTDPKVREALQIAARVAARDKETKTHRSYSPETWFEHPSKHPPIRGLLQLDQDISIPPPPFVDRPVDLTPLPECDIAGLHAAADVFAALFLRD